MKKKRLFQRLGATDCPNCGETECLWLVEKELTFSKMSKSGKVAKTFPQNYEVNLVCPYCGTTYNVKKKGLFFVIDHGFPEYNPIVEDYNPFIQG